MKPARALAVTTLVLSGLAGLLVGCQAPGGVLEPLPAPYLETRRLEPTQPLPSRPTVAGRPIRGATIVIDAGHGGRDPGAWKGTASTLPEKTIVLDIANKLARGLAQRGARVINTRTTDVYLSLDERAAIAEQSRADLFVSIHADSAQRLSASGAGVHIHNQASIESQRAAFSLVGAFRAAGIESRGIFRNNFHVLREHSRPAVLIECGFLTNPDDARKLNSDAYRTQLASAITEGIANYFAP